MKHEITLGVLSVMIVLSVGFLFFGSNHLAGFAVYDYNSQLNDSSGDSSLNVTREQALESINDSELIINEMVENNFSIVYMSDNLVEAKRVLRQVDYAEILRGKIEANQTIKKEAEQALKVVNWKNLGYASVLNYTEDIKSRKDRAFEIYDSLTLVELSLEKYENRGIVIPEARGLLVNATVSFSEDRYSEAESFIILVRENIDSRSSEASVLGDLKRGLMGFFSQYWPYVLIVLFLIAVIGYFVYKRVKLKLMRDRIRKMKAEERVLDELMKKAQVERFKESKISGLTYNVRMNKYHERLNQIKQDLPVLEARLKEMQRK